MKNINLKLIISLIMLCTITGCFEGGSKKKSEEGTKKEAQEKAKDDAAKNKALREKLIAAELKSLDELIASVNKLDDLSKNVKSITEADSEADERLLGALISYPWS